MATKDTQIHITRWQGGQHPTSSIITRMMKSEGLRPYKWNNAPNYRYAVRSHNYNKVLYVLSGNLELTLPDTNQRTQVNPGDRIDIPAGVRHGTNVGKTGVECVEAALANAKR